jgi:hypothetical protein
MTRLRSILGVVAVLAVLSIPTVAVTGAASAATTWQPFQGEFTEVQQDACGVPGLTLETTTVVDGRERFSSHGPDTLPYYQSFVDETNTITNVATGAYVTRVAHYRFVDLKLTDNGDGTYFVIGQAPGHQLMYNQDGQVIARGAGLFRFEEVWDNGGTPTDPSDDFEIEFLSFEIVGNPFERCPAIIQAIG